MKHSFLILSRILAAVLRAAIACCCVILPPVVKTLCDTADLIGDRAAMTDGEVLFVTVLAYLALAVAAAAIVFLWRLLGIVHRGEVFTDKSSRTLRFVASACFGEAVLFLVISYYFQLAIGVTLAAALLGFSLLVVCEVLKEGTRIKTENDFTV